MAGATSPAALAGTLAQTFAETKAEAVGGEVEDPVAEGARGLEHIFGLIDGEDIRQALCLRRLEQVHMHPWLVQDMRIEKLQPVQVELDRAP